MNLDKLLDSYIEGLKGTLSLEAVVLFGSRARGEELVGSDVDLAVVSPDFEGVPRRERIYQLLCLWEGPPSLEPLGYTPEEFLALSGPLLWDIVDDGKALYDRGVFAQAQQRLAKLKKAGRLARLPEGWRDLRTVTR